MNDQGRLHRRVALVTGAAGAGIGRAIARRLGAEGARVVVTDSHAKRTAQVAAELSDELGTEVLGLTLDVCKADDVLRAIATVATRLGDVDLLVNSAAVNQRTPVWEVDEPAWTHVVDVALGGTFRCTRAVLPAMVRRGSGVVLNVTSIAGYVGTALGESAYAAAKAGIAGFTRACAAECGPYGVRVNAIAPGVIANPFAAAVYPEHTLDGYAAQAALRRFGTPDEVAALAAFLASDEAAYITGEVHTIAGGLYMRP